MKKIEEIKQQICESKYKYISFDVFDTVLVRPFWNPSDLFYLLDVEFEKHMQTQISFHEIRINGETGARSENKKKAVNSQDITLDEIYEYIEELYSIPREVCQKIKQFEMDLELEFLTARVSVRQLYEFALSCNKKVIFITDMYMNEKFIRQALELNGYQKFEKIFVSSEEKLLKKSGDLYTFVLKDLKISSSEILHLGDNEKSDIEMARSKGIDACYIPSTHKCFVQMCGSENQSFISKIALRACSTVIDYRNVEKSMGFRNMLAIVANKYFDNPYIDFSVNSDFNEDVYFMGYYVVGMHLLGLNQWIEREIKKENYRCIWFTSRDGWLVMQAYNELRKVDSNLPEAKYLYLSREATLPIQVLSRLDFYNLPIEYWKYSPETLIELLKFCCKKYDKEYVSFELKRNDILYDEKFRNVVVYQKFIKLFLEKFYDEEMHERAKEIIRTYFSDISADDVIFDMGYSGRIYYAISKILNRNLNVLFVYSDAEKCQSMERKGNFVTQTLYDYTPSMPGMLREFILSATHPSCIGYYMNEKQQIIPKFEDSMIDNNDILGEVHRGAIDFIKVFYNFFNKYKDYIFFKASEVSLPFEGMLESICDTDRKLFESAYSEDKIYGRNPNMNMARFWKNKINEKIGDFVIKEPNRKDVK